MSDYAHSGRRSKVLIEAGSLESRLMFAVCWVLFLVRAVVGRMMPWRHPAGIVQSGRRESIFSEASTAASVCVSSSFIGL